jgi:AraC family transcriptional regulator, arabinose operon regulatory protein
MPDSAIDASQNAPAPAPGILLAGHFNQPPGYHIQRSRGTHDWLMMFTLAGRGRNDLNGQRYTCQRGDVMLLSPDTPHDYGTSGAEAWEFYWAHFIPRPTWISWLRLPALDSGLAFLHIEDDAIHERMTQGFRRLLNDNTNTGSISDELSLNALEEILLLIAQYQSRMSRSSTDARVEIVLDYLAQHIYEPVSIEELAKLVAISPSRLAHLFKEQVGDSPLQMFLKLRLRHAARLLEFTSRPIYEIASDLGFQSPFHFSRRFKLYYHVSPVQYRRQVRNKINDTP